MTTTRFNRVQRHGPADGLADAFCGLDSGPLRAAGEPHQWCTEDPARILAACRLSSELGLGIEPATLQALKAHKMRLARVPAERVVCEVEGLLLGPHVRDALMQTVDVLVAVMPEIAACRGFEQRTPYHIYDVWEHTAWVVQRTPATPLCRWAALFHDIGKPGAWFMDGDVAHFYGHPRLSVVMARDIMERLGFEASFKDRILVLVRMHDEKIAATPEAVRQAIERMGGDVDLFRALCHLKHADALSQSKLALPRLQLSLDLMRVLDELVEAGELA